MKEGSTMALSDSFHGGKELLRDVKAPGGCFSSVFEASGGDGGRASWNDKDSC